MTDTRRRYGVIGCGMMGQEHLRNLALLPEAEVVAIYEPDAAMRAATAELVPGAAFEPDLEALLARPDLDCLLIASPNFQHLPQLEAIARSRQIPILVEKPLFTDPADAPRVAALAQGLSVPVWVGMEYRYMPPIAAFLRESQAATGGVRMLTIREHRFPFLPKVGDWNRFNANTGGTLVEKCCHFFDLMRHVAGCDPVRVMASGGQAVNHLDEVYGNRTPDIWDHAYVIVDFASGLRAMLELCMFAEGARFQEEISAVGPTGKIEVRVPGPGRFWPAALGPAPVAELEVSPRDPAGPRKMPIPVDPALLAAGDHNGATYYQHAGFLRMMGQGHPPEVGLTDGWWAVAMGMAAQESARTGRVVEMANCGYAPPPQDMQRGAA